MLYDIYLEEISSSIQSINKIDSDVLIDDAHIDKSILGDVINFDNNEMLYFLDKAMIKPNKLDRKEIIYTWDDEFRESYIVKIYKRVYGDSFIYEFKQSGTAEKTNRYNKYQGMDRDVFSIPFKEFDFDFINNVIKSIGIYE